MSYDGVFKLEKLFYFFRLRGMNIEDLLNDLAIRFFSFLGMCHEYFLQMSDAFFHEESFFHSYTFKRFLLFG